MTGRMGESGGETAGVGRGDREKGGVRGRQGGKRGETGRIES